MKAVGVVVDSKTNYPAACNSAETLLVSRKLDTDVLFKVAKALIDKGVVMKCCKESYAVLNSFFKNDPTINGKEGKCLTEAVEEDYETEFLDLTIAVKIVDDVNEAIEHINTHGSHHTDCIITESEDNAKSFMEGVDSAGVYWNASTRFADGFRYGFGAEIGVSTNKVMRVFGVF